MGYTHKKEGDSVKKIHPRLAFGITGMIYYDCLFLFDLISGIDVFSKGSAMPILFGLPFLLFFAPKLSNGYDEHNNNDRLFYIIGAILILLGFIFLSLK